MRGRPCFTEHLLEFAREKQGGNAAVLFTALFSFCPIIDPAWRVRAVRHLKRGFMSVFHWIEKIPIRISSLQALINAWTLSPYKASISLKMTFFSIFHRAVVKQYHYKTH
jgi:hypothetical protein